MKTKTRQLGISILSVGLAAAMLVGVPAASAAEYTDPSVIKSDPVTLDSGHIDAWNPVATGDGEIQLVLKEDATGSGVLRTPESVTLKLKTEAYTSGMGKNSFFSAINLPEGDLWYLPLVQDYDLIWPGWDTMGTVSAVSETDLNNASADIQITDVQGPGTIYLWSQGEFGAVKSLLEDGSYTFPGTIHQDMLAHVHANWGFTASGTYKVKTKATITSKTTGRSVSSDEETYTFEVAPVPSTVTISGAEQQAEAGSDVTLTAEQTPEGSTLTPDKWQTRASDADQWVDVPDSAVSSISVSAVDGTQYRAHVGGLCTSKPTVIETCLFDSSGSRSDAVDLWSDPVTIAAVDKTALRSAVNAADALTESDYTAESWAPFASALAAARTVLADDDATQDAVDAAAGDLTAAQAELVEAQPVVPAVDKVVLQTAVNAADALTESDYTAESWAPFASALAAARTVLADDDATQDAVDAAADALTAAQAALVEAAGTDDTNTDDNNNTTNNTSNTGDGNPDQESDTGDESGKLAQTGVNALSAAVLAVAFTAGALVLVAVRRSRRYVR